MSKLKDIVSEKELIDTQWDVNEVNLENKEITISELIDTQWDVNQLFRIYKSGKQIELIDTQWDVNFFKEDVERGKCQN